MPAYALSLNPILNNKAKYLFYLIPHLAAIFRYALTDRTPNMPVHRHVLHTSTWTRHIADHIRVNKFNTILHMHVLRIISQNCDLLHSDLLQTH